MSFHHKVLTRDGSQADLAGVVIGWNWKQRFYHKEDVKAFWKSAGLPENILGDIDKCESFKRAIKEEKKGNDKADGRNLRVEEITKGKEKSYQYYTTNSDGQEIHFELKSKVSWSASEDRVICDNYDLELVIHEKMKFMRDHYTNDDLSRYCNKLLKGKGFPIRDAGGSTFIPITHLELITRLFRFFVEVDSKGKFTWIEVANSQKSVETLQVCYQDSLKKRLEELLSKTYESILEGDSLTTTIYERRSNSLEEVIDEMKNQNILTDHIVSESTALVNIHKINLSHVLINKRLHPFFGELKLKKTDNGDIENDSRYSFVEILHIMKHWGDDKEQKYLAKKDEISLMDFIDTCIELEIDPSMK